MSRDEAAIARELAQLSASEIVDAAAASGAPRLARLAVELLAKVPSVRLGKILARFDVRVGEVGLGDAAREVLVRLGANLTVEGDAPKAGSALVVMNHPGAFDALATMAALGRDDVALVASERAFVRALPRLCDHIVFVADSRTSSSATARAAGLRNALAWLERGGVLVQFGAGAIEADARFAEPGAALLGSWQVGTGVLAARAAKLGAAVVPAFVSGVHSRRAKRSLLVRLAERRGITTIAPLLQATLPGFRDVEVRVRFGAPLDGEALVSSNGYAAMTQLVRSAVEALAPRA
jgi:hypothetical protein